MAQCWAGAEGCPLVKAREKGIIRISVADCEQGLRHPDKKCVTYRMKARKQVVPHISTRGPSGPCLEQLTCMNEYDSLVWALHGNTFRIN